jgi:hypothetical protein
MVHVPYVGIFLGALNTTGRAFSLVPFPYSLAGYAWPMDQLVLIHAGGMPVCSEARTALLIKYGETAPTTSALGCGIIARRFGWCTVLHPPYLLGLEDQQGHTIVT